MKKPNITKGEWQVSNSGNQTFKKCVITDKDGGSVCFVTNWSEHEANAELICKAGNLVNSGFNIEAMPELVDILNKLVYDNRPHDIVLNDNILKAKKILQKATFNDQTTTKKAP